MACTMGLTIRTNFVQSTKPIIINQVSVWEAGLLLGGDMV